MQNAMRRVVVTGLGAITPLAVGLKALCSLVKRRISNSSFTGARPTWRQLIDSKSGITSIKDRGPRFAALPSQVAGVIPSGNRRDGGWQASEWLQPGVRICKPKRCSNTLSFLTRRIQDERKMALFAQYAMACTEEALEDAGWHPTSREDLEATVRTFFSQKSSLAFLQLRAVC